MLLTNLKLLILSFFLFCSFADESQEIESLIEQLENPQKTKTAIEALVKKGKIAVPHLSGEVMEGTHLIRRGWAIVCLSEIGGSEASKCLYEIYKDSSQLILLRTWAAAACVKMTKNLEELVVLIKLIRDFPALDRPITLSLLEKTTTDISTKSLEQVLRISLEFWEMQIPLAAVILGAGKEKLIQLMISSRDQEIRRQSAAYLATLSVQGDTNVASALAQVFLFSTEAKNVPWEGGPLFIPSLNWDQEKKHAHTLAKNLFC
ncbi:MAG: hypothetical protein AABZ60_20845, partial [Planctomycetota bacterium]